MNEEATAKLQAIYEKILKYNKPFEKARLSEDELALIRWAFGVSPRGKAVV